MPVKADAVGRDAKGGRLADVVQQRAPRQSHAAAGFKLLKQHKRMSPHIALRMVLCRLGHALHARDLRQNLVQQRCLIQQFECPARMALGQHLGQLVADPLAANEVNARGEAANRAQRFAVELEAEARSETHGAQHAQVIFFKTQLGSADSADDPGLEIGDAANVVEKSRPRQLIG